MTALHADVSYLSYGYLDGLRHEAHMRFASCQSLPEQELRELISRSGEVSVKNNESSHVSQYY